MLDRVEEIYTLRYPFFGRNGYSVHSLPREQAGLSWSWYIPFFTLDRSLAITAKSVGNASSRKKFFTLYEHSLGRIVWSANLIPDKPFPLAIYLSPSKRYLAYVTGWEDKSELLIWEIVSWSKGTIRLKYRFDKIGPYKLETKVFYKPAPFQWFPDEKDILFLVKVGEKCDVIKFNLETRAYRVLTTGEIMSLSPDGEKLAVVEHFGPLGENRLKIIELGNSSESNISVSSLNNIVNMAWSSSGKGIYVLGDYRTYFLWAGILGGSGIYYVRLDKPNPAFLIKKRGFLYWGGRSGLHVYAM